MENIFAFLMMTPPAGEGGGGGMMSMFIMFGLVILIMYFMMIRPQQKRQKEHQNMLNSIRKGDKVVTTAGMHGTVAELDEKTMTVQVAENVKIKFERTAIASKG
ncbi:MAG: preprotein translocase subunit YajC [Candidatus Kapabacteria bacterium]|nr:preprotein translocase subunit YajC [Ignavibacteriota bacterium]MCW5884255.1 preprotein translocase subunit YajC [Candidatus Kapabacteria bacterium]